MVLLRNSRHAEKISRRAVTLARRYGNERGWTATNRVKPSLGRQWPGIDFSNAHYLRFQEGGTRPFVMWWAEGRVIPLKPNVFRLAKGVGQPGWVNIEGKRIWRDQKWRHPGIKPTRFMEDALKQAVEENKSALVKEAFVRRLRGQL